MCWGDNRRGQLTAVAAEFSPRPVAIPGLADIVQLSSSTAHICALRRDGTVRCWGDGEYGKLGDGQRLGLQGMADYDSATVCVEGRSISVGSNAIFDVYNPANGCGVEAQISNSWDVHAVGVELGDCLIPGVETQAVRIEPTGGSGVIGLVRVRVTLHGAVY